MRYFRRSQRRLREVLAHRQRVDVAEATMVEVARSGMVHRVRALPVCVRRHRQHAQARANEVGGGCRPTRRSLTTTKWWKEERGERVFIDFNQMARDRTIACAYSLRANARATVSRR